MQTAIFVACGGLHTELFFLEILKLAKNLNPNEIPNNVNCSKVVEWEHKDKSYQVCY